ncbi:1-deoxy-D-xylulose 5-phosphate reductoisomerase [Alkalihalobacillus alcalophilus ATCC 27647 = CGMCC 1.3604]|uniref:1-deoxy-D-xylulose 5-phosphate reductoisomerase n=1 Tax=Alkalihalobacillus alcalophilus ATCC 27647 = CGMCC 1.3604 TaxID=1218173 RepID=A0A094WQC3_ALKAL|nr:1-deoxy-D-xylulose-5-phosphate reductoisomerase [Alkalihalobacillus alcalophilus]KGA98218.1 1-deoxy-D-xylulose 5-phosphate reductoisomerase [Alkalihalobacillus alcalophilus ATCC 27647 = CGMCC 1.3604]MED1562157.1 1-deoxy-D-xylulose-5-phosphate reductoisomerase [Alkalihalobacillus alcalophilus]
MKKIGLLGSTGSIGTQTLDVIREHPEQFLLISMSVGQNIDLAKKQIQEFKPKLVSVLSDNDKEKLKLEFGDKVEVVSGHEGLVEVAVHEDVDVLVNAVIGSVGLKPTLAAIEEKKQIAIANKETLVTAGHLVTEAANRNGVTLLPVDSEHSAIFQALNGERTMDIERLILTASGGSFRDLTRDALKNVTVEQALNHPNWSMGAKITIDSATMMNKGLEVIEAHWLFNIPYEQIDVLLHKESIIHSMVEFHDKSVMAQLGTPDMRVPIQYALTYPKRLERLNGDRLNLWDIGTLNFAKLDFERYRSIAYAYEAGKKGGSFPTVLNAANEEAVAAFLNKRISFLEIERLIEQALEYHVGIKQPTLEEIIEIDQQSRDFIHSKID